MNKWILILITILFVGGIFAFSRFSSKGINIGDENKGKITAALEGLGGERENTAKTETAFLYSFSLDDDRDGLSNAEEIIWGSDPRNPDTDSDGFKDGEEVRNNFDPVVAGEGKGKLTERKNLNETQKYLIWSRDKRFSGQQIFDAALVNKFLDTQINTKLSLPTIEIPRDKKGNDDSSEARAKYLVELASTPFPTSITSYQEIAEAAMGGNDLILTLALSELAQTYGAVESLVVPPSALDLHKKQLAIIRQTINFFEDLKNVTRNPLIVEINLRKANEMVGVAQEIDTQKTELNLK